MVLNALTTGYELSPEGLPPVFGELITPSTSDLARESELIGKQALSHMGIRPFGENLAVEAFHAVPDERSGNGVYASGNQYHSGTFTTNLLDGQTKTDDRWDKDA